MGENKRTVAMARMELEDLYSGLPDDSVNLTFQDMTQIDPPIKIGSFNKIPSLDFKKGLEAGQVAPDHRLMQLGGPAVGSSPNSQHHHNNVVVMMDAVSYERSSPRRSDSNKNNNSSIMASPYQQTPAYNHHHGRGVTPPYSPSDFSRSSVGTSMVGKGGGGRRPGIPHSNICTICSIYIYIFKNRCLVCGRVYCRNCFNMGMGDMTEGRKCVECVGRRFSARYIRKAGAIGCYSRYPLVVKQAELKWAEKGPRRSGERAYDSQHGNFNMKSGSSTPMASPFTPSRTPPSYLMGSPYSPYSSSHHHLPL